MNIDNGNKKELSETEQKYLGFIRHPEYHSLANIYPSGKPYMLYRGLKSIYHVVSEITQNGGHPAKGAVWITNSYDYAVKFGPAFVMHIDPESLSTSHPGSFIPDKPGTFTTGKAINLYKEMFLRSRQNLKNYLLAHFPELQSFEIEINSVLDIH